MKQIYLFKRLFASFVLLLMTTFSWAYDFQVDGIYYNKNSDGTSVTVTNKSFNNGYSGSVTIPATVTYNSKNYNVTSIGGAAFDGCSGLTSVTIGNGVTSIGDYAFHGCSGLTSVTIGNGVTSIGVYAFSGCNGLTSVIIPNSVKSIGNEAFYNCSGLTSVTIPNSVASIGEGAFYGCSGLTSVTIPNSVTNIGVYAFYDCSGLTSITIPNSVTSIGDRAFENCSGLTSVTIPNSVTSIGKWAFSNCSGLPVIDNTRYADTYLVSVVDKTKSTYNIKEGTRFIGEYAFYDCSGLTSIDIPNSVTSIGGDAFSGCSGLTSIKIPESVTSIGDYAFSRCSGLTKAEFASIESLCNISFNNAYANPLYFANHLYVGGQEVKDVDIPNSVTSIGNYAFYGCSGLTSVTIPESVTSIGEWAFFRSGLTCINIPNSVTSIGNSAFDGCSGLTSIDIPNSVTSIGNRAFEDCSGLTSITIPESVTSIGDDAFFCCSGLKSVYVYNSHPVSIAYDTFSNRRNATLYVPKGAKTAYEAASYWKQFREIIEFSPTIKFADANVKAVCVVNWDTNGDGELDEDEAAAVTSLGEVFKNNTIITSFDELQYFTGLATIGDYAFCGCSGLTSITIPNSVTSIGNSAFDGCSGLTSITIPEGVTSIGERAFYGCSGLTSITIPNSVTSIDYRAFSGCSGLTSVTIPNSVMSIGDWAFYSCSGLTSVTINSNEILSKSYTVNSNIRNIFGNQVIKYIIGSNVTSIGNYAFSSCSGLTSVTIPESVTSIGNNAFSSCSGLTSVTIPESVTSIGSGVFQYCSGLKSVTIPESVTSIDSNAFSGCSGLTSVTIPSSVTSIGNYAFSNCPTLLSVVLNSGELVSKRHAGAHNNLTTIFGNQVKEYIITDEALSIGAYAFSGSSNLVSVNIPQNATAIGACAFENCTSLVSISIPESIKNIEMRSFNNCSHLGRAEFANVERLCEISFGDKDANPLSYARHLYIDGKEITDLIIPESVESIGAYAFKGCSNINSITCLSSCVPQTAYNDRFEDIPNSIPLIVSEKLYASYRKTFPWSKFQITPQEGNIPPATYKFYQADGSPKTSSDIADWIIQKEETPNVIAIVETKDTEWANAHVNVLIEKNSGSIKTYFCPNFVLTDLTSGYNKDAADAARTSFYTPVSFTADKGRYLRKATVGFNSVCLPFSFAASDLSATAKVCVFDSFDSSNNNVLLREVNGNVSAGTPCFVRETADVTWNVNLAGKTITANKPTVSGHTRGTYVTTDQYQGVGYSPRKSDNVFAPLALYLHPFRACFARNDLGLKGSSITISLIDKYGNMETLMDGLVESGGASTQVIYTLGGQRISEVKRSGVYIINGKKTYVEVK